jgi:hypothetical protein
MQEVMKPGPVIRASALVDRVCWVVPRRACTVSSDVVCSKAALLRFCIQPIKRDVEEEHLDDLSELRKRSLNRL